MGEEIRSAKMEYTHDPARIRDCGFIIVCVPTPIDDANIPDLSFLESASELVGRNLAEDSVVVFESTVFPGATETVCVPIIERFSGLGCGEGFYIGYSPERINPGDKEHRINTVVKIVSGMDEKTLNRVDEVYSRITKTHRASSIRVAEGAKVIENVQRDLNIALMNELAIIFERMGIRTEEVLEAAATKWNFHRYHPGLVGGHCIGVDPYYLTFAAKKLGFHPQVILAGRRVNDNMHKFYASKILKMILKNGTRPRVLIKGLTFKPNVPDYRNSRVKDLISELKDFGVEVCAEDPFLAPEIVTRVFGARIPEGGDFGLKLVAVQHDQYGGETDCLRLSDFH